MTRKAARVFLQEQDPDNPPLNYSFDVLVEGDSIVPKIDYFGLRGFHRGGPCAPVLLFADGTIDFGSDFNEDERWEQTNLLRKPVRIGAVVSFWSGASELPKSKDDEFFYVIRNITDWASRPTVRRRPSRRSEIANGKRSRPRDGNWPFRKAARTTAIQRASGGPDD